ncbi:hotdog family protein [Cumulibacter manganitolerans]|uniref:hypothetical protein n=1 Tax=Cumulibacter manganitolerans TaxID=1884992 RepID=UPI00129711D5|nr:hypothetical protein [Cumulibacter manganitolerans]
MITRDLIAYNTATQSTNKIHDDETARRFGFTGGLVPGVEVHGYLSWGPVSTWGEQWLTRGRMTSRYRTPTYDGDTVTVTFDPATGEGTVGHGGRVDATAAAAVSDLLPVAPALVDYPDLEPPPLDERPAASPHSLARGRHLGAISVAFPDAKADRYLDDVREVLPIYTDLGVAHPGWVLGLANELLMANVVLGPWIHVGSTVQNFAMIGTGARVSCRGRVADQYEKSGHRFVELDVAVFADDQPVTHIAHVAIYEPRQVREA